MDCEDGSASTEGIEGERRRRRQLKKWIKLKRFADFCYCERIARLLERMTNLKNSDLREEEGLNVYDL